jgi:hypothetical protein
VNAHLFDSDWDYQDQYEIERNRKESQAEYDADMADCCENDKDDVNYPW